MSTTTDDELTPADAEWIAAEATHRLAKIYREYGWPSCPRISAGTVRVVLETARERTDVIRAAIARAEGRATPAPQGAAQEGYNGE